MADNDIRQAMQEFVAAFREANLEAGRALARTVLYSDDDGHHGYVGSTHGWYPEKPRGWRP